MPDSCRICQNNVGLVPYTAQEKMMGSGETFEYFQCPSCGCLQIATIPENLGDYYSSGYYSYKSMRRLEKAPLRRWGDSLRVADAMAGGSLIGRLLNAIAKPLEYLPWVEKSGVKLDARILDVGCGQGRLLLRMALGGFQQLTGIDPFVNDDIHYANGVRVLKQNLEQLAGGSERFDFIMLHHSLEHMPDQAAALQACAHLLAPGGVMLLRIPLSDSYAWEHYRENWVQLDAPRHLYLHSRRSITLLAAQSGLSVSEVVDDSAKFQFTGSELYRRGIALNTDKRTRKIFTRAELKAYSQQATQLNTEGRGDQAAFYLRHHK